MRSGRCMIVLHRSTSTESGLAVVRVVVVGGWIYHNHAIMRHVLEHLIKDLVNHSIVSLGNRETDGGDIQIRRKFTRTKYRFLCDNDHQWLQRNANAALSNIPL